MPRQPFSSPRKGKPSRRWRWQCHGNSVALRFVADWHHRMRPISFKRHRFPPEIIRHAIWLYVRFTPSLRDVEELLAERGIDASYETVRR